MLVGSTGVIGVPLPMDRVEAGIRAAAGELSPDGGAAAADRDLHHRRDAKLAHGTLEMTAARCASAAWRRAPG